MALLLRLLQSLTFLLFINNNSGRQLCCFHLFMKERSWTWYLKCYKYWLICFSYWEYCQDNLFSLSSFVSKCRVKLFGWNTHVFLSTSYQWQSNLFLLIQNVADFLQRMRKKTKLFSAHPQIPQRKWFDVRNCTFCEVFVPQLVYQCIWQQWIISSLACSSESVKIWKSWK